MIDFYNPRSAKARTSKRYDELGAMIAWENGTLSERKTQRLFRHLVKTGLIYQLQGVYGREAHRRGLI